MTNCTRCSYFTLESDSFTIQLSKPLWGTGIDSDTKYATTLFDYFDNDFAALNKEMESDTITLSGIEQDCIEREEGKGLCFPICFPICFTTVIYELSLDDKFCKIIEMSNNHEEITITGISDQIDDNYKIRTFLIETIAPTIYKWTLTLERINETW